ncbi:MAG: hypothetical protein WDW36_006007 [Sanguina aurantia]
MRPSTVRSHTHQFPTTFSASITPSTPSCDPATPEPHTGGGAAAAAAAPTAHQHQQAILPQQLLHLLSPEGLGGSFGAVLAPSHSDFLRNIHTKLAVNCAINPLTALLRCKNGGAAQERRDQSPGAAADGGGGRHLPSRAGFDQGGPA